jgi:hypothetical protein
MVRTDVCEGVSDSEYGSTTVDDGLVTSNFSQYGKLKQIYSSERGGLLL